MQDTPKAFWNIPYVPVSFSKFKNKILLHIILLKYSDVQIAVLKFTSCDNQALVVCIPIAAVAVHLKLKS